ncbi:MAG: MATE family efflux transporter [Planctomycetota bacterium]|jgi:putative MATE family efflux protein
MADDLPTTVRTEATANRSPGATPRYGVTTGPVRRTLFVLALPVLGEQLLNTFVGLFDTYLAGNLLGDINVAATGAIGLAAYVGWLVSMIVMLVGTGTTALVTRHEGAGDHAEANRFANQSLTLALILGVFVFGFVYTLAPWLASYCRMTGRAAVITITYLRVDAVGYIFMSVLLVGSAGLRGVGNMRTPLAIYAVINAINVIASLTLVYGLGPFPSLGVNGIVGGTLTARILGAFLMLFVLARGRAGVRLRRCELPISRARTWRILRIGVPAAADGAVMWTGHFVLLAIISRLADPPLGPAYFAAHIIAVRVEAFTYLPAVAWATATATMIGQALGAGKPARAKRTGHEAVLQCGSLSIIVALLFFFGAGLIYRTMHDDPLVQEVGVGPFRILALLQPLLVISIVYIHGLRGAGDTRFPLLITVVGTLLRVALGAFCGLVLQGGLLGAWAGMFCDMTWRALAASLRFQRGRWIHTKV